MRDILLTLNKPTYYYIKKIQRCNQEACFVRCNGDQVLDMTYSHLKWRLLTLNVNV